MTKPNWIRALLALGVLAGVAGCKTPAKTSDTKDDTVATEAPLGSRIKKKKTANPISVTDREEIERQRVQQGAIQTGIVNNPSKYGGRN